MGDIKKQDQPNKNPAQQPNKSQPQRQERPAQPGQQSNPSRKI